MTTKNADTEEKVTVIQPQGAPPPQKAKHGKEGESTPPMTDEERRKKNEEDNRKANAIASGKEEK